MFLTLQIAQNVPFFRWAACADDWMSCGRRTEVVRYFSHGSSFSKRRLWTSWASCPPLTSSQGGVKQAVNTDPLTYKSTVRMFYTTSHFHNEHIMLTEIFLFKIAANLNVYHFSSISVWGSMWTLWEEEGRDEGEAGTPAVFIVPVGPTRRPSVGSTCWPPPSAPGLWWDAEAESVWQ